jgi:ornithine cyclodeaminase
MLKVFDIDHRASKNFVAHMSPKLNMEVIAVEHCSDAFINSDVISTATTAREPYVDSSWYAPGVFHAEISFWDTPPAALTVFDQIYVDDWYQVKHHGVDVSWRALEQGLIDNNKIAGELGEVVACIKNGRNSREERIFFNPIGLGIHDLSEAHRVYQNALAKGIGTQLTYFAKSNGWLDSLMI